MGATFAGAAFAAAVTGVDAPAAEENVYATVNGKPIMARQFNSLFDQTIKNRYYHGKVPEGQEDVVRKEVLDRLVERILLLEDAEKRGFKPDQAMIEQAVVDADAKYTGTPMWNERERMVADLRGVAARKSLIDQIEKAVRDVPQPAPEEVRTYYNQHPDLFTEPVKLRLSVILFRVDPSSPLDAWAKSLEDAQAVYKRLKKGEDFAELALKYSGDKSAAYGGDLGYIHRNMQPEELASQVDRVQVGELSEPIKTLEGFSIFRVVDRILSKQHEFSEVEGRARDLLMREKKDQAWKANIERLRSEAKIEILAQSGGKKELADKEVKVDEAKKESGSGGKKKPGVGKKKSGDDKKK